MASKFTVAIAPPELPTTFVVVIAFAAVPISSLPRVASVTPAPASTFVVTEPVSREASSPNEKAPPLQLPTVSSIDMFDEGRIEMPPGESVLVPELMVAESPITTREPASSVIVVPAVSPSPENATTPPPVTRAE